MALDPGEPGSGKPRLVQNIHELTPYGMVLAGLGTCTAFVVNTYAEHHSLITRWFSDPGGWFSLDEIMPGYSRSSSTFSIVRVCSLVEQAGKRVKHIVAL
jgi:hypothetical protein